MLKSETCINSVLFKITPILSCRMHRVCRFKRGICDLNLEKCEKDVNTVNVHHYCVHKLILVMLTVLLQQRVCQFNKIQQFSDLYSDWSTSYLIRALVPYHSHLLLLLNHVVIVVKLCCVEGLREDKCTSNKHSRK